MAAETASQLRGHLSGIAELCLERVADCVAEIENRAIGDKTVDAVAFLPPADDARLLQQPQVFAHVGLGGADDLHKLADGVLAQLQGLHEPDPQRLSEDAEARRYEVDGLRRKLMAMSHGTDHTRRLDNVNI